LPGIEEKLLKQVVGIVQQFREQKLSKTPGVSETIDWAESLMALGYREVNAKAFEQTLGTVLKSAEDISMVKTLGLETLLISSER
jgi:hypothetical protein